LISLGTPTIIVILLWTTTWLYLIIKFPAEKYRENPI
jgi:hypothetical protein